MQLKIICLTLLASIGFSSVHTVHSITFSCKNIAIAAGALVAGKIAYNYFFTCTDAQEFEQAIQLCERNESYIKTMHDLYRKEIEGLYKHTSYSSDHMIPFITTQYVQYPFSLYASRLQKHITDLMSQENTLSVKIIHIFERRAQNVLSLANASHTQEASLNSYIEGYDFALEELKEHFKTTQSLRKELQKIKHLVVTHPQYTIEQDQKKLAREQALYHTIDNIYYPTYSFLNLCSYLTFSNAYGSYTYNI